MKLIQPLLLLALLASPLPGTLAASEYNEEVQTLVDQLREIAERSRRERAADRWLQRSLEELISQHDWPWREELLYEDFSDGDFNNQPQWQPVSGQFWVDPSLGLRSRVYSRQPEPTAAPEEQAPARKDVGTAILGALLQEALRSKQPEKKETPEPRRDEREVPAEIHLPIKIPGTFAFKAELSSHNPPSEQGKMQFGFYEGQDAAWGYLISLHTGDRPVIELAQLRGGRYMLIEEAVISDLNDGQPHEIEWRKNSLGETELLLDQQVLVRGRDRDFAQGFGYLAVINQGGDFGIRSIQLQGGGQ
ncbi:hypothetical protein ACFL0R_03830 [Pseudomonadota bacterium]